jgi:PAS domain S-box-containing protein
MTRYLKSSLSKAIGKYGMDDIAHAMVPMYIFDPDSLTILSANEAALRLYGYAEEEFLRLNLSDIRPAEEAERTKRFVAMDKPDGLWFSGVWKHRSREGRIFSVSAMGIKVLHCGKVAVLAIVTDLTQTLRAPDASAVAGHAMLPFAEQMDEVCWIRNLDDSRLVYLNSAFERVFGVSREAAYADQDVVLSLVRAEDAEAVRRYRNRSSHEPARLEYCIRRPDGELRWLASRRFPLVDAAGARLMAGFVEDITERKLDELRRVEAVEAQRDALVREVHHRIKNSLQGVTGLLRRFATAHPPLAPLLAEAAAQVQSLAAVHGLQGRSASGRVKLCELLRSVADGAQSLMQARIEANIPSHCDPCLAIADKDAVPVALALNEIVVNAVKHGKPGGRVRLDAAIDAAAGTAEIRVVNPGRLPPGFNPATGSGNGNGLQLIRMLLPPQGARFNLCEQEGEVTAILRLAAPVIVPLPLKTLQRFGGG